MIRMYRTLTKFGVVSQPIPENPGQMKHVNSSESFIRQLSRRYYDSETKVPYVSHMSFNSMKHKFQYHETKVSLI